MPDPTRPFLVVYVVWHPAFNEGAGIAEVVRQHFRRQLYENVAGGSGLSVIFRSAPAPGSVVPMPIDLEEANATAIVVLADPSLVAESDWVQYVRELVERTETVGFSTRVFPVSIEASALTIGLSEQALRWDLWAGASADKPRRLTSELTYEFCRMLRHQLARLRHPAEADAELGAYIKKVQVFISHSKHDADGTEVALRIRDHLHSGHGLASFFDVYDIPAGLRFQKVLLFQVRFSAVVAVHTDSYSSREWCRREIIEAKRWQVPLVVANCISDVDERGFPYMGNVPVVRLEPHGTDRVDFVVARLLDEVLKDFLWACRIETVRHVADPATRFLPRPPELISLAGLTRIDGKNPVLVYPDPPLSTEEERLFEEVAPDVQLRSFTEWLSGATR